MSVMCLTDLTVADAVAACAEAGVPLPGGSPREAGCAILKANMAARVARYPDESPPLRDDFWRDYQTRPASPCRWQRLKSLECAAYNIEADEGGAESAAVASALDAARTILWDRAFPGFPGDRWGLAQKTGAEWRAAEWNR